MRGRDTESILHGLGIPVALALAALGAALGLAAFASATLRAQRRKRFVRAVSEQRVPGFRIDEAPEGRVLVREPHGGTDYRVTDLEEELVAIDEAGEVLHEIRGRREQRTLG